MPVWSIREVRDNDIMGIARLRTEIKEFRPISIDGYVSFWRWLIKANLHSIQRAIIAVKGDEVIAHYAMVPFGFLGNGKPLMGGFLCQLMVAEAYRRDLIFPKMEMKFINEYRQGGYDFIYSLSNRPHVVKAHLAFGFTKIGDIPVYARPMRLSNLVSHFIKDRLLLSLLRLPLYLIEMPFKLNISFTDKKVEIVEVERFEEGMDEFFQDVKSSFTCIAMRDHGILNWRFQGYEDAKFIRLLAKEEGRICGYAVVRRLTMKGFDVLAIVDIMFFPSHQEVGNALLHAVHRRAVEMRVEMVACLINPHSPIFRVFKRHGYLKTPESFTLFLHEPRSTSPSLRDIPIDKWHITWFDNDSV